VTGAVGIATARTEYLNGCVRYLVEGEVKKDGKVPEPLYFDEGQLTVIDEVLVPDFDKSTVMVEEKTPGGPPRCEAPRY
jgi:hypothetical protein